MNRGSRRGSRGEEGIGIVEVIVAIVVLLVVLVPSAYLISSTVQQTTGAKERVAATELADEQLEEVDNLSLTTIEGDLDQTISQGTQTVAGITYSLSAYMTWLGSGSAPDLCSSGSPPESISVSEIVKWGSSQTQKLAETSVVDPSYTSSYFNLANGSGESSGLLKNNTYTVIYSSTPQTIAAGSTLLIGSGTSLATTTVTVSSSANNSTTVNVNSFTAAAAYPAGTPVSLSNEGYLAVQVDGASGSAPAQPSKVSVQIQETADSNDNAVSNGTVQTYTPDTNGCVYVEEPPAYYTVTLSSSTTPPFIDTSLNQSPSSVPPQSAPQQVTSGSTTTWTWNYDQAANVTFASSNSVSTAGGIPVSVYNSGLNIPGSGNWTTVVAAGTSASSAYLYPFTSPYSSVWYGDCLAEQPVTLATVTATEGGSETATMGGLAALDITPESASGGTDYGAAVMATVADPNNSTDSCPTDSFTLPSTSSTPAVATSQGAVVQATREDTGVTLTSASASVTDSSISSADFDRIVTGTGVPANSYVTSVSGTSFTLCSVMVASATATCPTTQKFTGSTTTSGSIYLTGNVYTVNVGNGSNNATIYVTSGGEYCTSGCPSASTKYLATGSPAAVEA